MDNKHNFQKLTPINKADMGIYNDALNYVFDNPDIKNVGISGAYSAGKSSVIETYKTLRPDIKFMHISLANFQPSSADAYQADNQNENVLEGKILNQLIHQIEPAKIPQTNFRVKRQLSSPKLWLVTALISSFSLLLIYILNFSRWGKFIGTLTPAVVGKVFSFTTAPLTALLAGIACVMILFYLIFSVIKEQFNRNLFKGISVQGNTIEIFEQSEESFFDKYLNEVLYLFENSDRDVIVFEDMDRYNTNQIFQRLREINTLVNSRKKSTEKPLRFFYLMRDDIFISKERTKFFDFIMPVVPVLDGSNSYDQFIAHFKKGIIFDLFNEHFLQEISLYIDDMRILKNIYNEFLVYHNRISTTEQDPNKLLAIIIYKNIFPRDFSDLQLNSGFVNTLFSKKDEFINDEIARLRVKIDTINSIIEAAENEHLKYVDEVNELINPKIQELQRVNYYNNNNTQINILIAERDQRISNLNNRSDERLNNLKGQISKTESDIIALQNKKLHEIINKENVEQIFTVTYTNEIGEESSFNEIKGSDYFALIKYLIRNGYIDETYPDYMTYFYEHSLSRIDKIFLRSVTDQDAKDYTYQLKNPEIVLTHLSVHNFEKEEILNFDLSAYLLEHQTDINKNKLYNMLVQIKEGKNYKFVSLYFESGKRIAPFVKVLNNVWTEAFYSILSESNFTEEQKKNYALQSIYHTTTSDLERMNSENALSDFIASHSDFLDIEEPDSECLIEVFRLLDVKFLDIDYEKSNKELFQDVYANDFYVIGFNLVCLMLSKVYGCSEESELKQKNYTLVLRKPDEPLVRYIQTNLNEYVSVILEHCEGKISDSEVAVQELLNDTDLESSLKSDYIDKLNTPLSNLQDIDDISFWPQLLDCRLIVYSESNVLQYFCRSGSGLDKSLADFINSKGNSFNFYYDEIDSEFEKGNGAKFFYEVVRSEELNIKTYASILNSLNRHIKSFNIDGISDAKMDVLIDQGIVTMIPEVLLFMRGHYQHKIIDFIKHNIQEYTEVVISEETFDFNEMLEILETDIDDKYKLSILVNTVDPISAMLNSCSVEVKAYILQNNLDSNDIPKLLKAYPSFAEKLQFIVNDIAMQNLDEIIQNNFFVPFLLCKQLLRMSSVNTDVKSQLFAMTVDDFSESECKECLSILNYTDLISAFNGKRPAIPITDTNQRILDIFVKKRWIVGYDVDKRDESLFRISSRRIAKRETLPTELL
ncbi:MAG: hypothetical protein CVU84_12290 [Firmicutes bacterium HGW-Firmicutes-1]|jgi:hypothetical protein|nr:MAG: hypothetical protein CVU84_12290 [Firmicutes bacterium HGW-Firmicutes-1]